MKSREWGMGNGESDRRVSARFRRDMTLASCSQSGKWWP